MRCAILGDIHANIHALEAVVADARAYGCTEFQLLGDVVGYGAFPSECVELARSLTRICVLGNHDQAAAAEITLADFSETASVSLEWTRGKLSADQRSWLGALMPRRQVRGTTLVHASLDSPLSWGYVRSLATAELSMALQGLPVCFIGHTHVPIGYVHGGEEFSLGIGEGISLDPKSKYLINAGSVGQPRDGDWRAAYLIHDEDEHGLWLRRVEYDVESAASAVLAAGLPEKLATRLRTGS
jgi:diadenosine tetraphosphatase ApaH/serine/threonine PP2A family protein phosphatase